MRDQVWSSPVRRMVEHSAELKSFYVDDAAGGEPGQFVMLWLPGVDQKPISISDRCDGLLELTVKAVGHFSRALMGCGEGTLLGLRGPYGHGFELLDNALLVGGGCGVAPLRFLHRRLVENNLNPTLLMAGRTRRDVLFIDDLAASAELDAAVQLCTDDGSGGRRGLVTEALDQVIEARRPAAVCAAGPEPMMVRVLEIARRHKKPIQLSIERYMKCGLGLCGSCCLDPEGLRVCVEGPVFDDAGLARIGELGQHHRDATGARRAQPITACER